MHCQNCPSLATVLYLDEFAYKLQLFLALSIYAWAFIPFTSLNFVVVPLLPLPRHVIFDFLVAFVGAVPLYMYFFGVIRSFGHKYR